MRNIMVGLGAAASAFGLSACTMDGGIYPPAEYSPPPIPEYSVQESADDYAFIDKADALWAAIGDAPPDHAFAFEGAEPWAWETREGYTIVVEETSDGIRSYYFEPSSGAPFLAVEPGMSFGFDRERVAVVYGADGGALPRSEGAAYLDEGADLYARGQRLKLAMRPQEYAMVDTQAWIDASVFIAGYRQVWDEGKRRHPGWRQHRDQWQVRQWRGRLEQERLRRMGLSEGFRQWREGGFRGDAPGRWRRPGDRPPGTARPPRQPGTALPPRQPGASRPPRQPGQQRPPRQPGAGAWQPTPDHAGAQRPGRPPRPEGARPGRRGPAPTDAGTPAARPPRTAPQGGQAATPSRPSRAEPRQAPRSEPRPPVSTPKRDSMRSSDERVE